VKEELMAGTSNVRRHRRLLGVAVFASLSLAAFSVRSSDLTPPIVGADDAPGTTNTVAASVSDESALAGGGDAAPCCAKPTAACSKPLKRCANPESENSFPSYMEVYFHHTKQCMSMGTPSSCLCNYTCECVMSTPQGKAYQTCPQGERPECSADPLLGILLTCYKG